LKELRNSNFKIIKEPGRGSYGVVSLVEEKNSKIKYISPLVIVTFFILNLSFTLNYLDLL